VAGVVGVDDDAQRVFVSQCGAVDAFVLASGDDRADSRLYGAQVALGAPDGFLDALDEVDVEGGGQAGDGGLVVGAPGEQAEVGAGPLEGADGAVAVDDGQVGGGPPFGQGARRPVEVADGAG
jgi:hypothetical protein